ncbi:MAG TPA: DUF87 domain-containing protein [Abditibacteriaceae bacterium]|jgi:hypothetical protein
MLNNIAQRIEQDQQQALQSVTADLLGQLVQTSQYVGEVYSIGYETALLQIHDFHRERVGGIPSLSFLVATRFQAEHTFEDEEASVLLLRVMDAAALPTDAEAERVRVESARRVSGEPDSHWDGSQIMDAHTHQLLSFAGVRSRVIGTFYLDQRPGSTQSDDLVLRFGCDLSNYYPNRGLKVYKPNGDALQRIVNYLEPERMEEHIRKYGVAPRRVALGTVRYASTNRSFQGVNDVPIGLLPADLLGQKSALFGMTRTGKSNTTKIILQSVFELRYPRRGESARRIGQIVFDPNGEYANENVQDEDDNANPAAIKNVWQTNSHGDEADVVTYGITKHPLDPNRRLMKLNFFEDAHLQTGKEIIDVTLSRHDSIYIKNFCQVRFEPPSPDLPEKEYHSAMTRYNRVVLVYRGLLAEAGFAPSQNMRPVTDKLFNADLLKAMEANNGKNKGLYVAAAQTLRQSSPTWNQLFVALQSLAEFMNEKDSGYSTFEQNYVKTSSTGDNWANDSLRKLLTMVRYDGTRLIGKAKEQHTSSTQTDYATDIYNDLVAGKLVIVDQSSGEPELNKSSSERIMWHIFRMQQTEFREGRTPHDIVVYVEEAHNILPAGSDTDTQTVWVRTAKEGAKYNIGLVYATQEVSSIQRNILKNTANWFIGHLNNADETKELCKFYDFADFEPSIRRAQDKGFLRVKTLSNLFVIPVQVRRFEIETAQPASGGAAQNNGLAAPATLTGAAINPPR